MESVWSLAHYPNSSFWTSKTNLKNWCCLTWMNCFFVPDGGQTLEPVLLFIIIIVEFNGDLVAESFEKKCLWCHSLTTRNLLTYSTTAEGVSRESSSKDRYKESQAMCFLRSLSSSCHRLYVSGIAPLGTLTETDQMCSLFFRNGQMTIQQFALLGALVALFICEWCFEGGRGT